MAKMATYLGIKESLGQLEKKSIESQEEQLYQMLKIYLKLFPVHNGYLFRYSPIGYLGEGVILVDGDGLHHIGEIRDDLRTLPVVYPAVHERKAKYFSGMEYFKHTSSKYIIPTAVTSVIVVPIFYHSLVIGYICSNKIKKRTVVDEQLLSSFTEFGRLTGSLIFEAQSSANSPLLSNRELEVMRRISWGDSIKEMANKMGISDSTVKQYIKTALQKLGAKNRTHAIGKLFRMGIIS